MEQRREPRFSADQSIAVTLLSEPQVRVSARVKNASGRGLGLEAAQPIPPGTALRIEIDDAMVLGEAVYCRTVDGAYFIGVELDQVLVGLAELGKTLRGFAGERSRSQTVHAAKNGNNQHRNQPQEQKNTGCPGVMPAHQVRLENSPHRNPPVSD